jgi:hypothetical protein
MCLVVGAHPGRANFLSRLSYVANVGQIYLAEQPVVRGVMGTLVEQVFVSDVQSILLHPRPFATSSGRLILLPLLPQRPATMPLPTEIWTRILCFVFAHYEHQNQQSSGGQNFARMKLGLLLICKTLKVRVDTAII